MYITNELINYFNKLIEDINQYKSKYKYYVLCIIF